MRSPAIWIQWTVIFLVLGAVSWIAYPEIDPFKGTAGLSDLLRQKQAASWDNEPKEPLNYRQHSQFKRLWTSVP